MVMYVSGRCINFASFYEFVLLDFGNVPTVWYVLVFILLWILSFKITSPRFLVFVFFYVDSKLDFKRLCLHAVTNDFFFREWQISWFLYEYSWRNSTIVSVTILCGKQIMLCLHRRISPYRLDFVSDYSLRGSTFQLYLDKQK